MKKLLAILILFFTLTVSFPITAHADMGPKASLNVNFINMGDELCYGTLLSKNSSTGPHSAWEGDEDHIYDYGSDRDIWLKFAEYEDSDGYYFLQLTWKVSESKSMTWGYYPPNSFKILLYYPEEDVFVSSGIYERYAFDTYYTVDMNGFDISSVKYDEELSSDKRLNAYRSYLFWNEMLALCIRVMLTVVTEILIALSFSIIKPKQLLLLLGTNVFTQILLNLLLNVFYSAPFLYVVFEIAVFAIEAFVCAALMNKFTQKPKRKFIYVIYALVANAASFALGIHLAEAIAFIF